MSAISIPRRKLLQGAALLAGGALLPAAMTRTVLAAPRLTGDPFTLGVASGEPTSDGMVLWTRLATRPLEIDGGMPKAAVPVSWEVAEDAAMRRLVARGRTLAAPEAGHSVHVDITGLKPAREYWYRFAAAGAQSPVGRTRTAPAAGAAVDKVRFCFASCQKYETGFYGAYAHMVEDAPDFVLFLGDYIYEGAPGAAGKDAVRRHANPEPQDIGGYRVRYANYKSDPLLQAAHAAAPWTVTWDDHEVSNDYGGVHDQDDGDPAAFLRRRAAAYQAYYEHMPLRRRAVPVGPDMLLYRTLDWGRLLQIQVVDDRQYRDAKPCRVPGAGRGKLISDCDERRDPRRSILGQPQEAWLLEALGKSQATWNMLAQQTLFSEMQLGAPGAGAYSADGWDGYPASRARILARWREAKVSNPVALGGDIHAFAAADLHEAPDTAALAAVFVGGSITSLGADNARAAQLKARNPHISLYNGEVRGYGRVDVSPAGSQVAFRALADARDPKSTIGDLAKFTLDPGRPGLHAA